MMIQSVWKNLTGLQKDKSWSQLNTSGVTLNADLEPIIHHQTPMTCTFIIWTKVLGLSLEEKKALPNCGKKDGNIIHKLYFHLCFEQFWSVWNDCTRVIGDEFLVECECYRSLSWISKCCAKLSVKPHYSSRLSRKLSAARIFELLSMFAVWR